jgi:polynucleotide 5'-hydroxyl-kinase GRC3/NOL9
MGNYEVDLSSIEVPKAWKQLDAGNLNGVIMVVGDTDTGKSTLAAHIYHELVSKGKSAALLDGDPGQGTQGPPTTMNLTVSNKSANAHKRDKRPMRWFVGSTSPRGHMLPIVVGASRLVEYAYWSGADCVVYDTTGLIAAQQGGLALKLAKIDLLRPSLVIAIQRDRELNALLIPLRRLERLNLVEMSPAGSVIERSRNIRQRNRANRYEDYFSQAKELQMFWPEKAVFPRPHFTSDRLLGLEGEDGYLLGLGILLRENKNARQITLLTPLGAIEDVKVLRLGDVAVDPVTFQDKFV